MRIRIAALLSAIFLFFVGCSQGKLERSKKRLYIEAKIVSQENETTHSVEKLALAVSYLKASSDSCPAILSENPEHADYRIYLTRESTMSTRHLWIDAWHIKVLNKNGDALYMDGGDSTSSLNGSGHVTEHGSGAYTDNSLFQALAFVCQQANRPGR